MIRESYRDTDVVLNCLNNEKLILFNEVRILHLTLNVQLIDSL